MCRPFCSCRNVYILFKASDRYAGGNAKADCKMNGFGKQQMITQQ